MLIDYEYLDKLKKLRLSIVDKNGKVKIKEYNWSNPTIFKTCDINDYDAHSTYKAWNNMSLKEIPTRYPNKYSVYHFIDSLPQSEKDEIFGFNEPDIFFVDIETEIISDKPTPENPKGKVLSIAIVNKNTCFAMGLKELSDEQIDRIQNRINNEYGKKFGKTYKFKYKYYLNEYDMLNEFFNKYTPIMTVITGWFFVGKKAFDWIYLVNRAKKLTIDPAVSSPSKKLQAAYNPDGIAPNEKDYSEIPLHRMIIDYLQLYKKWDTTISVKEADQLDFVAGKLLGVKKVSYESNLKVLYNDNFEDFIFYNVIDSVLVQLIHEKQRYIDTLYGIATFTKITASKAFSTLNVSEGLFRNDLRSEKNILLCKNLTSSYSAEDGLDDISEDIKGGWVKDPRVGMWKWVCCFDFASLYPTTMRQFNISSDSYKGLLTKDGKYAVFNNIKQPILDTDIVLINGTVFKAEVGVITKLLTSTYQGRKDFKGNMGKAEEEMKNKQKQLKLLEEALKMK